VVFAPPSPLGVAKYPRCNFSASLQNCAEVRSPMNRSWVIGNPARHRCEIAVAIPRVAKSLRRLRVLQSWLFRAVVWDYRGGSERAASRLQISVVGGDAALSWSLVCWSRPPFRAVETPLPIRAVLRSPLTRMGLSASPTHPAGDRSTTRTSPISQASSLT
jgi:hypothetical protein